MSHHIIEFDRVGYTYPDGHEAVRDFLATIRHGETVGLIGPNGAGKSTVLHLLAGVLQPCTGEIRIGGIGQTRKTLPAMQSHLGLVFQDPNHQLFMPGVYENVAFGPRNMGLSENQVKMFVEEALEQVGIRHLVDRTPSRLSAGEKKTVAMASVMAMRPDILALDEPTSALDPRSRRQVMQILESFQHTKIIASHDLDLVWDLCDRVILVSGGHIQADGDPKTILSDSELLSANGLELPFRLQNQGI